MKQEMQQKLKGYKKKINKGLRKVKRTISKLHKETYIFEYLFVIIGIIALIVTVYNIRSHKEEKKNETIAEQNAYDDAVIENAVVKAGLCQSFKCVAAFKCSDWKLVLVNPWNYLPEDYVVETTNLPSGIAVDARCYDELMEMFDAANQEGYYPMACSGYRSYDKQERLYDEKQSELIYQGYDEENAAIEAGTVVAVPGTSEHQLGLAVDLVSEDNQNLDDSQENSPTQQWLMNNSWKYGFILRYPTNKSDVTGIIYEPWHYRYVGKEAAKEIHDRGICFEEYITPYLNAVR